MKCVHINIRKAIFVLLSVLINTVHHSQIESSGEIQKNSANQKSEEKTLVVDVELSCPSDVDCNELHYPCLNCNQSVNCVYGNVTTATCQPKSIVKCNGIKNFTRSYICRYCYQTEPWEHTCELKANCNSVATPKAYYRTNCTVKSDILCLGNRTFYKNVRCNWTGGYKWSTALALSITLGGFGADRFYLGHWQEGIGKLFSFGGLGVWTLIDVILISLHYLGPADGSLYI